MRQILLVFFVMCLLFSPAPVAAESDGTAVIVPVAPLVCPPGGCAAGQRLSYRLEFEVGSYAKTANPNLKVCVYIPESWFDSPTANWMDASTTELSAQGGTTGLAYQKTPQCLEDPAPPSGYALVAAAAADMTQNFFQDSLDLSFRINAQASGVGFVLLRVFEHTGAEWTRTSQMFTSQMQVAARSNAAYIAADPAACSFAPCYLNSAGDQANGLGTGLRDAVDALDAQQSDLSVTVLGAVNLKGTRVVIDKPVVLRGQSGSLSVEPGAACQGGEPLLEFTAGGALRQLTLDDGGCSGANGRTLVRVNSPQDVLIESNSLLNARIGLAVVGNQGNLTVRYNEIAGNSSHAVYWNDTPSTAQLRLVANNLYGAVECSAGASAPNPNRLGDHNYWGSPVLPDANQVHCSLTTGKQLGAPIAAAPAGPGVDARRVSVSQTKAYAFNNQIAYKRVGGAADFDLYIVNHGAQMPESLAFPGSFGAPNLCSNVWDVFLAEGAQPGAELDLYFKYELSDACTSAVENSTFCGQTSAPQNYPLWWHDPRGLVTGGWDTTGQNPAGSSAGGASGQATSCSLSEHEIMVAIDGSGRPSLADDLGYTPFLVGIPVTNTFTALASDKTVTLDWTTLSEPGLDGYVVLRSLAPNGPFDAISDLIDNDGGATYGSSYSFVNANLTNGTTYYYRLKVLRADGGYTYSDTVAIVANIATLTPTPTATRTPTVTLTFTPYFTLTPRPTLTPFRYPTTQAPPATRVPSRTATRFASPTGAQGTPRPTRPGEAATLTALATLGEDPYPYPYPYPGPYPEPGASATLATTLTRSAGTNLTLTPPAKPQATPTPRRSPVPTLSYEDQVRNSSRYVSLVLGLLLGGSIFTAAAWLIFFRKRAA